jgi:predicted Ser/Thr protein kinase
VALSNDAKWTGTNKEAHDLVRDTVLATLDLDPVANYANEPTQAELQAREMFKTLVDRGYTKADARAVALYFFNNSTHPSE